MLHNNLKIMLLLLGLLITLSCSTTNAQNPNDERVLVLSPLETLQAYVNAGNHTQARLIVDALTLALDAPDEAVALTKEEWIEFEFLRGRLAMLEGNFMSAVLLFENIISRYPNLERVRLELGLALFNIEEDARARYHFDLALQRDIPTETATRLERIKQIMHGRRHWQVQLKTAFVPDSNINAATNDRTVEVFGLPFMLSEDARETSGVGALADLNVQHRVKLTNKTVLSSRLSTRHKEYKGNAFDDTMLSFYTGPERLFKNGLINFQVGGFRRWFGGRTFNWGLGGQLGAFKRLNAKWGTGISASLIWVGYDQITQRSGLSLYIEPYFSRAIGTSGHIRTGASYSQDFARERSQANRTYQYNASFRKEFPGSLLMGINATIGDRQFKGLQPSFDRVRKDTFFSVGTDITFGKFRIFDAAIKAAYQYQSAVSSISFFSFSRHRFELSLTKEF